MIYLLLSFLFLPFSILATPLTLAQGGALTLAALTNSTNDAQLTKRCPAPPEDADPIIFGIEKIGFIGWIEYDSLTICLDVNAVIQLTHCYGSLENSESVECGINNWVAKGDVKIYVKNQYELWLHLEGTIFKKSWNKDIHIMNLPHNQGLGTAAASFSVYVSQPAVIPTAVAPTSIPSGNNGAYSVISMTSPVTFAQMPSPSGKAAGNMVQGTQPELNGQEEAA